MKKLLTVVLLLALGIMAIGSATNKQDFQIRMNVMRILKLEAETGVLDFGNTDSTTVSNIRAIDRIKVTGPKNTAISFETTQGELKNGDSVINYRSFVSKTKDGTDGRWAYIGDEGIYEGYMVAQIDYANLEEGAYRGTVTLEVSYY